MNDHTGLRQCIAQGFAGFTKIALVVVLFDGLFCPCVVVFTDLCRQPVAPCLLLGITEFFEYFAVGNSAYAVLTHAHFGT